MRKIIQHTLGICVFICLLATVAVAQDQEPKPSPAASTEGTVAGADIEIHYSSPAVKGRTIWGDLVPYAEVWRAGANEATTFYTSKAIKVQGESLPAGLYAFFLIPAENGQWIGIFNKQAKQWGAFEYDESQDQLRVVLKPEPLKETQERLTYSMTEQGFELSWDKLRIPAEITE